MYRRPTFPHFPHFALLSHICPTFWQFVPLSHIFDEISQIRLLETFFIARFVPGGQILLKFLKFSGASPPKVDEDYFVILEFGLTVIWMPRTILIVLRVVCCGYISLFTAQLSSVLLQNGTNKIEPSRSIEIKLKDTENRDFAWHCQSYLSLFLDLI